jgi:hypothetical protein
MGLTHKCGARGVTEPSKFHLSVNADGVVSLWDTEAQARGVSEETYVGLELTAAQHVKLKIAAFRAQQRQETKEVSR